MTASAMVPRPRPPGPDSDAGVKALLERYFSLTCSEGIPALKDHLCLELSLFRRHPSGYIDYDDINFEKRTYYDGWASYGQSKLANVLHARELARRLAGTGVTAVSLHPGTTGYKQSNRFDPNPARPYTPTRSSGNSKPVCSVGRGAGAQGPGR